MERDMKRNQFIRLVSCLCMVFLSACRKIPETLQLPTRDKVNVIGFAIGNAFISEGNADKGNLVSDYWIVVDPEEIDRFYEVFSAAEYASPGNTANAEQALAAIPDCVTFNLEHVENVDAETYWDSVPPDRKGLLSVGTYQAEGRVCLLNTGVASYEYTDAMREWVKNNTVDETLHLKHMTYEVNLDTTVFP